MRCTPEGRLVAGGSSNSSPTLQFDLAGGEAYRNGVVHLSYALKAGK